MTGIERSLVEVTARLLEPAEREAVLGDQAEAGEGAWQSLIDILGLFIRRQAVLWTDWRPWLSAFIVALPGALLLMGVSFSVSCTYRRLTGHVCFGACAPTGQEEFPLLLCHLLLLMIWSWTGGFVVGCVSKRTLWVSAALALGACVFCLARFNEPSLSRLCLLLFIPPAILGVLHGSRTVRLQPGWAFVLAISLTVLMSLVWSNGALWALNWALIIPACYIAMAAWGRGPVNAGEV